MRAQAEQASNINETEQTAMDVNEEECKECKPSCEHPLPESSREILPGVAEVLRRISVHSRTDTSSMLKAEGKIACKLQTILGRRRRLR